MGIGPTSVVPLLLILLSGDPDEREAAGKNDNAAVKALIENFTPSAWKKVRRNCMSERCQSA